ATFGALLASGIQDISAFLPILSTDQCESHVGTALDVGYLCAAATPLSIFGCLGIVKASVEILVPSISSACFHGAEFIEDAGFKLQGPAAAMIGVEARESKRGGHGEYLANTRLIELLTEQHIN
ncbi:hypothetical protein B0H10DRAFT_1747267, partial [Mycena sp. CBHHK59/15]